MPRQKSRKYNGIEEFTSLTGGRVQPPARQMSMLGEGTFYKVLESAAPELYVMAQKFPKAFSRALKSAGYTLRTRLKRALGNSDDPIAAQWAERSRMHIYARMDLLKAGAVEKATGSWTHGRRFRLKRRIGYTWVSGNTRLMERWRGANRGSQRSRVAMGGKLKNAMRYTMINPMRVDVGAVTPSAAKYLEAVQAGRRGTRGIFQYRHSQPITPAMRRAFWAAGVPLKKGKTMLKQEERPLVVPVYQEFSPRLERYILDKIAQYLG